MKHKTDQAFHQNPVFMSQSPSSAHFQGSKDDIFFDSQSWLESDGEEDFVSVNEDSTPTSGNTLADQNLSKGAIGWIDEPSVKENKKKKKKKKKLGDLLKKGLKEDQSEEQEDISSTNEKLAITEIDRDHQHQPPKLSGTVRPPSASVAADKLFCSSSTDQSIANGDILINKAKSGQGGCFRGLVSCCSFRERKRSDGVWSDSVDRFISSCRAQGGVCFYGKLRKKLK